MKKSELKAIIRECIEEVNSKNPNSELLSRAAVKRPNRMSDVARVLAAAKKDFGLDVSDINQNELASKSGELYRNTNLSRIECVAKALLKMLNK